MLCVTGSPVREVPSLPPSCAAALAPAAKLGREVWQPSSGSVLLTLLGPPPATPAPGPPGPAPPRHHPGFHPVPFLHDQDPSPPLHGLSVIGFFQYVASSFESSRGSSHPLCSSCPVPELHSQTQRGSTDWLILSATSRLYAEKRRLCLASLTQLCRLTTHVGPACRPSPQMLSTLPSTRSKTSVVAARELVA